MKTLVLFFGSLALVNAQAPKPRYTESDNLMLYLTGEAFGKKIVLGQEHKKNVSVAAGSGFLFEACGKYPVSWKIDEHWWQKLAHKHPVGTFSCRAKSSPSLHTVSRMLKDYSIKTEVHLDGRGPGFPHVDEFLAHKMLFRKNDQNVMHRRVEQMIAQRKQLQPSFPTHRERTTSFLNNTFGTQRLAGAVANGLFRYSLHRLVDVEENYQPFKNRLAGALVRSTIQNSVEYGIASWRHEDVSFKPSGAQGVGKRIKYALTRAFVVDTPIGTELAYGRFAGVLASTSVVKAWHPWREHSPNLAGQMALQVNGLVLQSLWTEFSPDLLRPVKKMFLK